MQSVRTDASHALQCKFQGRSKYSLASLPFLAPSKRVDFAQIPTRYSPPAEQQSNVLDRRLPKFKAPVSSQSCFLDRVCLQDALLLSEGMPELDKSRVQGDAWLSIFEYLPVWAADQHHAGHESLPMDSQPSGFWRNTRGLVACHATLRLQPGAVAAHAAPWDWGPIEALWRDLQGPLPGSPCAQLLQITCPSLCHAISLLICMLCRSN